MSKTFLQATLKEPWKILRKTIRFKKTTPLMSSKLQKRLAWLQNHPLRSSSNFWSTFILPPVPEQQFLWWTRDKRRRKEKNPLVAFGGEFTCLMGRKKRACKNASPCGIKSESDEQLLCALVIRRGHITYTLYTLTHVSLSLYAAHIKCQRHFYSGAHKSGEREWVSWETDT